MGTQVFAVADKIWCIRRLSYFTCSYLVTTHEGLVFVDAGMDSGAKDLLQALDVVGKKPADVAGILLTHWHNDHAAGAKVMKELSNAPTYYHQMDEAFLTRKTAHHGWRGYLADHVPELGPLVLFKGLIGEASPQAVDATRFIKHGEVLFDDFEAIETPGHTAGHLAFYCRSLKALFAGDALAVINGRIRFMARPVTPDLPKSRKSAIDCLQFELESICPGHREPLTRNVKEECERFLQYAKSDAPWPLFG